MLAAVADVNRNDPHLLGRISGRFRIEEEPLLAELDAGAVIAEGRRNEGETWLPDPRVHDPSDRLTRGRLDGVPQIVRLGVLVRVQPEVMADALAKGLLAEVLLQHAEQ